MEDHERAPGRFEVAQRALHDLPIHDVAVHVADSRPARDGKLDLCRPASPPTHDVDAGPNEQSMEPGIEPVGVAQPRQVSPRGHQGVLDRVPRELAVSEDQSGRGVQPRDRRASEDGEGVVVAPLCLFDDSPLIHSRPAFGAAMWCALKGMSDGGTRSFPALHRAEPVMSTLVVRRAAHPEDSAMIGAAVHAVGHSGRLGPG